MWKYVNATHLQAYTRSVDMKYLSTFLFGCVANENLSTIGISNKNRIATHACIQLRKNWLNRHGILYDRGGRGDREECEWEEKNWQINIMIILVYDTTEKHWNSHWIFQLLLLLCGLSWSHFHQRNRKIYVMTMSEALKLEKPLTFCLIKWNIQY